MESGSYVSWPFHNLSSGMKQVCWSRGFFLAPTATSKVQKDESLDWKTWSFCLLDSHPCPQAGAYISQQDSEDLSHGPLGQFSTWEANLIIWTLVYPS